MIILCNIQLQPVALTRPALSLRRGGPYGGGGGLQTYRIIKFSVDSFVGSVL